MRNQNTSRPIIVYGIPQIVDGLKAAGYTVVTGKDFVETGIAAKRVFDDIGATYLVIGDGQAPGLQQWCERAITTQGCPAVHVLMPGTPAHLNLGPTPRLQGPVTAQEVLTALGLAHSAPEPEPEPAPAALTAPPGWEVAAPQQSSTVADGWGAAPISAEVTIEDALQRPETAPADRDMDAEPEWGAPAPQRAFDSSAQPQWIEPPLPEDTEGDFFSSPSRFTPASHQEEDAPWNDYSSEANATDPPAKDEAPGWGNETSRPAESEGAWGQPEQDSRPAPGWAVAEENRGTANTWPTEEGRSSASGSRQQKGNQGAPSWGQPDDHPQESWSAASNAPSNDDGRSQSPSAQSEQSWTQPEPTNDGWGQSENRRPETPQQEQSWTQPDTNDGWGQPENRRPETQQQEQSRTQPEPTNDGWGEPENRRPETPQQEQSWNQPDANGGWGQPSESQTMPTWEQPDTVNDGWGQPAASQPEQWAAPENPRHVEPPAWGEPAPAQAAPQGWEVSPTWQTEPSRDPAPTANSWGTPDTPQAPETWAAPAATSHDAWPAASWETPAPSPSSQPAPPPVIAAPTPLRSRTAHGYIPPTGEKAGKVIFTIGGKGGIGKSTMALQIAQALANAGYRTCLIDGNVGQPDLTAYLRILNGKHNGVELPSIYEGATTGERAAVISPEVLNIARKGFEPVKFGFVAGAPSHLNDANIVNEDIYAKVITTCQEEMSFVVVDLQIIEQSNRSPFVENLVIPALKTGGYAMALSDMSSPGVNNLRYIMARLKDEQMDMSRIGLILNRVENEQAAVAPKVSEVFSTLGVKMLSVVTADASLQAISNSGQLDLGNAEITNSVRRFLRETIGLPQNQFPDVTTTTKPVAATKGNGLFSKLWRK